MATKAKSKTVETPKEKGEPDWVFAHSWMDTFLEFMRKGGHVSGACRAANIGRATAYRHRQADEDFALAWADAEEASTERLEEEAYRRACEGLVRNKYDARGNLLCEELVYSDTLAIFLLKARRPDKYRERFDVKHSGEIKAAPADLSQLDLDEAQELKRLLAKAQREKTEA